MREPRRSTAPTREPSASGAFAHGGPGGGPVGAGDRELAGVAPAAPGVPERALPRPNRPAPEHRRRPMPAHRREPSRPGNGGWSIVN